MRRLWGLGLLAVACTGGGGESPTGGSTTSEGTTTASTATTGGMTMDPTGAVDDTGTDTTPPGSTGPGDPLVVADCRELLEEDPDAPNGVHTIYPGGDPAATPMQVYCDMKTLDGGWTLVGRSAPGKWERIPFGWQQATGLVTDDDQPYSLNALAAQLEFSEALLGSYTEGKTWGNDAYTVEIPEIYTFVYGRAPLPIDPVTVIGSCMPRGGPHHMRYMGWTEEPTLFHVADSSAVVGDGLEPGGWDTDDEDCDGGANLHTVQGMIMVR